MSSATSIPHPVAPSAAARAPEIRVVRAGDDHAAHLAAFYRDVWDPGATAEGVLAARGAQAAANHGEPGVAPPTFVVLSGERVIGHVGTLALRLWDGEREQVAYWLKGLMVLPEFRNGPVGYLVLKEAARQLPCSAALLVAPAARRLMGALGYREVGAMTDHARVLRPARLLAALDPDAAWLAPRLGRLRPLVHAARASRVGRFAAGAAGILLRLATAAARLPALATTVQVDAWPDDDELDTLWRAARADIGAAAVRDAAGLGARFRGDPSYHVVTARRSGRLAGVAIVRGPRGVGDPRLAGVSVATIADILFAPQDRAVGLALTGGAERVARACRADVLLCGATHPALAGVLARQAYLRLPGTIHLLVRDARADRSVWTPDVARWWLTRGDGGADEAF